MTFFTNIWSLKKGVNMTLLEHDSSSINILMVSNWSKYTQSVYIA